MLAGERVELRKSAVVIGDVVARRIVIEEGAFVKGSLNVQKDVPRLIELYRSGQLKLDELVSREIHLEDVNEAFDAMKTGEVARSVIIY